MIRLVLAFLTAWAMIACRSPECEQPRGPAPAPVPDHAPAVTLAPAHPAPAAVPPLLPALDVSDLPLIVTRAKRPATDVLAVMITGDGGWASIDRDIGNVCNLVIPERSLDGVVLPDPHAPDKFTGFAEQIAAGQDRFVQFGIGFSLFERAWTMRGMANLFMDMVEDPAFAGELLARQTDLLIETTRRTIARGPIPRTLVWIAE